MKLTVEIDVAPHTRPGTERAEQVRTAIWEAIDEVTVFDEDDREYALTVLGVGVVASRR